MKHLLPLLALLPICVACGGHRTPEGILTEAQMITFLTQAYLIEGYYAVQQDYNLDRLSDTTCADYRALLGSMGVTAQQVEQSLAYYSQHPDTYTHIHQQVSHRLDSLMAD